MHCDPKRFPIVCFVVAIVGSDVEKVEAVGTSNTSAGREFKLAWGFSGH